MQLIWVLVPTNDVLYNWIIMVLGKCKRIAIKKKSNADSSLLLASYSKPVLEAIRPKHAAVLSRLWKTGV